MHLLDGMPNRVILLPEASTGPGAMKTDQTQIKRPRYMGIATFMRAPLVQDLSTIDIALAGVPFDGGVTNRSGARHGPREVRNQSSLIRTVHPATRQNPFDLKRIGDIGDLDLPDLFDLEASVQSIHQCYLRIRWTALPAAGSCTAPRSVEPSRPAPSILGARFRSEFGVRRPPAKVGTIRANRACALFSWTKWRLSALKGLSGRRTASSRTSRVIYPSTSMRSTPSSPQVPARQRRGGFSCARPSPCGAAV